MLSNDPLNRKLKQSVYIANGKTQLTHLKMFKSMIRMIKQAEKVSGVGNLNYYKKNNTKRGGGANIHTCTSFFK